MILALDEGVADTLLPGIPRLVEHIFPDEVLKIAPALLVSDLIETHYDEDAGRWRLWPTAPAANHATPPLAVQAAAFLNALGRAVCETWAAQGVDTTALYRRKWRGDAPGHELATDCPAPPTLALWGSSRRNRWDKALAIGAAADGTAGPDAWHPLQGISDAAGALLQRQAHRVHGLALAITRESDGAGERLRLVGFDRAGVFTAEAFAIHDLRAAERLVRIVAGLMFAPRHSLGWDPTVCWRGDKKYVRVRNVDWSMAARVDGEAGIESPGIFKISSARNRREGVEFEVLGLGADIQRPDLLQNATVCWRARGPDGREYAMRESWDTPHAAFGYYHERKIVDALGHTAGVPDIVSSELVTVDGISRSTDRVRGCIDGEYEHIERFITLDCTRMHHRVLMYPYCEDVRTVESPVELLHIFGDVTQALARVAQKKVAHRDISMTNVRCWRPPAGRVRGMLIDMDRACTLNIRGEDRSRACVGTVRYASLATLRGDPRTAADDLESLVYLFVRICSERDGPRGTFREDKRPQDLATACWARDTEAHAEHKAALRAGSIAAVDRVLADFTAHFACLRPVAEDMLVELAHSREKGLTHHMLFSIIDKARAKLEREEAAAKAKEAALGIAKDSESQV
ncbi:hypothetical protein HDZ31DRAFT_66898 [Schizophyllum fasciatum]